jgi:hypothetical protein
MSLSTRKLHSPRVRSCRLARTQALILSEIPGSTACGKRYGGKTVRGPSIVLMAWKIFEIASEVHLDIVQINVAYNRIFVSSRLLCSVYLLTAWSFAGLHSGQIVPLLFLWCFDFSDSTAKKKMYSAINT